MTVEQGWGIDADQLLTKIMWADTMCLVHYTTLDNVMSMLHEWRMRYKETRSPTQGENGEIALRMGALADMNDKDEGGPRYDKACYAFSGTQSFGTFEDDRENRLLMWQSYGDQGNGCAIRIQLDLRNLWENEWLFAGAVLYENAQDESRRVTGSDLTAAMQQISDRVMQADSMKVYDDIRLAVRGRRLLQILPAMIKSSDWEDEREVRVLWTPADGYRGVRTIEGKQFKVERFRPKGWITRHVKLRNWTNAPMDLILGPRLTGHEDLRARWEGVWNELLHPFNLSQGEVDFGRLSMR